MTPPPTQSTRGDDLRVRGGIAPRQPRSGDARSVAAGSMLLSRTLRRPIKAVAAVSSARFQLRPTWWRSSPANALGNPFNGPHEARSTVGMDGESVPRWPRGARDRDIRLNLAAPTDSAPEFRFEIR